MADRRVFISALFLLSFVLVVVLKTVRFRTGLQCKTYVSKEYIPSKDYCEMGLEYERSSIDFSEMRNHDEWARSWTYFVALKYFKENGSFDHYWSRASSQISCTIGDRNRCFGQGIQQALIESESEFGVMFGQAERLQTCVFFQLDIFAYCTITL